MEWTLLTSQASLIPPANFKPNLDFLWSLRSQWLKKPAAPHHCGRRVWPTCMPRPNSFSQPNTTGTARPFQTQLCHPSLALIRLGWQNLGSPTRKRGRTAGNRAGVERQGCRARQALHCTAVPQRRPSQVSVLMCSLQKPHRAKLDLSSFSSATSSPTAESTLPFNSGEANRVFGKLN